jgi:hypothetical protein
LRAKRRDVGRRVHRRIDSAGVALASTRFAYGFGFYRWLTLRVVVEKELITLRLQNALL